MANELKLRVLLDVVDKALGPLKRIGQGSTGTARALKITRGELKALTAQQRDVTGYRQQHEAVRQTSEKLAQAQEKLRGLRQELKATAAPTAQFQRQFLRASQQVDQLTQRHGQQRTELHKLTSSLREAGADTRRLADYEQQLGQRMATTSRRIEQQQQRLAAYGRARGTYEKTQAFAGKAAVAGAAGMGVAYGIGRSLYAPIEEGKHYTLEANRIAALGLGDKATADAIRFAKAMRTYGTSATENLTLVRDALSVFADEHHAEMVAPTLAKMKFANEAMYGEEGGAENEKKFMDMLKVIELRGGLASKEAFEKQANIVQKVLTATGGRVGPEEWLNVIKRGGLAAKGLKDEAFYLQMEPLVQEMGGHGVGTALMSAYQNLYQGRTTKRAANNLEKLGLVDPAKLKYDKAGQIAFLDVGAIRNSELFRANQFEWMEKVLLPQLAAKGITEKNQVLDTLGSIFSNRTASNLFSQMYLQREQIHKNARLNAGADDIDKLYIKGQGIAQGKELEARARLNNAYLQAGQTILPAYASAIDLIASALGRVTGWMERHPFATEVILKGVAAVGLLAGTFGVLTLTLASLLGPFAILRYGAALFGIKAGGMLSVLKGVGAVLPWLGQGLLWLGRLFLLNPIGLAITAIAAGAYLIYRNWDAVKAYFLSLWAEIKAGFDGGLAGIARLILDFSPLGLFYRAFAGVMGYFGIDLPGKFSDFGGMLLDGLVSGIRAKFADVKNVIGELGDSTANWFKEKLGIHSPSRVFAQLGGFTTEGLAQGIAAGQGGALAAVTDLARKLIAAGGVALPILTSSAGWPTAQASERPLPRIDTRAPISTATPSIVVQGDTITLNITTGPGSDITELRRIVSQLLDERERTKAARVRARLGDME